MSGQELVRKIGRTKYFKEQPDGSVLHEALIYVNYTNPLQGYIGPDRRTKTLYWSPKIPGFENDGGAFRKIQPLNGLPHWRYEIFDCDAAGMAPLLTDYEIEDERADWMTDIFMWTPGAIVREEVRDFLEDTDPGGSMFFPTSLFGKPSGKELPGRFYQWFPKRRLFLSIDFEVPLSDRIYAPFGGRFGNKSVSTEFHSNKTLRDFVATLPIFCMGFTAHTAFNAATFKALKAEKFTGLVERPTIGTDGTSVGYDTNVNWNVGHFV